MKLPKKKYIFSKDELIAEVKKVKTITMKKPKTLSWETRFDNSFTWPNISGTAGFNHPTRSSVFAFIQDEIQTARLDVIEEIDSIVQIVIGYIGDDKEREAAENRWKTLKTPPEK